MYCIHCGAQIPDNVVFCTQCGKRVGATASVDETAVSPEPVAAPGAPPAPDAAVPAPAASPAAAPTSAAPPAKKTPVAVIVGVVAAIALAAGIGGYFFATRGAASAPTIEESGPGASDGPTDDGPVDDDSTGTDDGATDGSDSADDGATAPKTVSDARKEAFEYYLANIQQLQDEYGEGKVVQSSSSGAMNYFNGLGVVKLIDFNDDGIEELVCIYPESLDGADESPYTIPYYIEVWTAQTDGTVELLLYTETYLYYGNGGFTGFTVNETADGLPRLVFNDVYYMEGVNPLEVQETTAVYYDKDAGGIVAKYVDVTYGFDENMAETDPTYYVDGDEATAEEFVTLFTEFQSTENSTGYYLCYPGESQVPAGSYGPADVLAQTEDAIALIKKEVQ